MSVLVEGQLGMGGRPAGFQRHGAGSPTARRTSEEALRRPPRGTRVTVRPRPEVAACALPRTRRRWRVLLLAGAAVCALVVVLGAVVGGLAEGMAAGVPQQTAVVAVAPGDTLWDVAARYAPESDPRAVVARIEQLNGVSADDVTAGLALTVPVQSAG